MAAPAPTVRRAVERARAVPAPRHRRRANRSVALVAVIVVAVTGIGLYGAYRYIWTFWLYRGFPAPSLPLAQKTGGTTRVVLPGTLETIEVDSPAVGQTLPALVYLPPGYFAHPHRRYPAMYLLHGVPGSPQQFVDVGDAQIAEALLVARRQMPPVVLVMPQGAPSLLDDTEWVNGAGRDQAWMDYVATDVVGTVDARFRVLDRPADRAIAGLSEGGYGALNIGLQHLGEFGLIESWSGYTHASTATRYFAGHAALVAANSPAEKVLTERAAMLRDHTYLWFYCGRSDEDLGQNVRFDEELALLGLPHHFFARPGGHNWKLWRSLMSQSLIVAGRYFAGGPLPGEPRPAGTATRHTPRATAAAPPGAPGAAPAATVPGPAALRRAAALARPAAPRPARRAVARGTA